MESLIPPTYDTNREIEPPSDWFETLSEEMGWDETANYQIAGNLLHRSFIKEWERQNRAFDGPVKKCFEADELPLDLVLPFDKDVV